MLITRAQRVALHRKWLQNGQGVSYRAFRATVEHGANCIMVFWCNMWLGIESDGYTHS